MALGNTLKVQNQTPHDRKVVSEPIASEVMALLGPTNTGKTHRAVERMLEHDTGMIGLPLRLLAREIYDRITAKTGEDVVALVTGEERRVPKGARYWVCTVEAMPVSVEVDFLAVDEVQLVEHPQRGHVFTQRLLGARGRLETWFLGARTVEGLVKYLVPAAKTRHHPRLSSLCYRGGRSLSSLPPRTVVVTFTVPHVYELADAIRRKRGGAAVVLGDLSPRARNAQVALFQSGDVDYLVATDAIGMGLNLDVDHVALARLNKFDGTQTRSLDVSEIAQIVGRAGRYIRDGTFGTLNPLPELPPKVVRSLELHQFSPIAKARWRNAETDTESIDALIESLKVRPRQSALRLVRDTADMNVLIRLSQRDDIRRVASSSEMVALLWDVCQIPDYRRLMPELHARVVADIFIEIARFGPLTDEFLAERVLPIDCTTGDIHALTARLSSIRTWTYASHRSGWLKNARKWQEKTREIEDRLSDALHDSLVQRFADREGRQGGKRRSVRRGSRLSRIARPAPEHTDSPFAKLLTLDLALSGREEGDDERGWVSEFVDSDFDDIEVTPSGIVRFGEWSLARLQKGSTIMNPQLVLVDGGDLTGAERLRVERRLRAWVRDLVSRTVGEVVARPPAGITPAARALLYQLGEGLGTVPRAQVGRHLGELTAAHRRSIVEQGLMVGQLHVFMVQSFSERAFARRAALSFAHGGRSGLKDEWLGRSCVPLTKGQASSALLAHGYAPLGDHAVRVDVLDGILHRLSRLAERGPFEMPEDIPSALGVALPELSRMLHHAGYRAVEKGTLFVRLRRRRRSRRKRPS